MIAALLGVGALTGGGDDQPQQPRLPVDVERVARDLERVRGLEFKEIPPVSVVSPEDARAEALELLDRDYPPQRRAADMKVLELLGLVPEGTEIEELVGTIFGEEVAGYYDHRKKEMTLVADGLEGLEGRITVAHELTHALEDQRFGLDIPDGRVDDAATAATALHEGTATIAMLDYASGGARDRDEALEALGVASLVGNEKLPPYLQRSLTFPYVAGARFVDAIGTWGPANRALRGAGPVSTEQVLHPAKYRARERPLRVRPGRPRAGGWKRAAAGTIGEFDTAELIRTSDSPLRAERAAAGWGGGAYALWQKGGRSIVTLAWRWDTPRDAAEFVAALPRYIERTLGGRPAKVEVGETVRLTVGPAG